MEADTRLCQLCFGATAAMYLMQEWQSDGWPYGR